MKVNRMTFFVCSITAACFESLSVTISYAVEKAPCCPPSLSKLGRVIAAQLKQITNSSSYQMMRMVILIILAFMILYVLVLILLALKREAKSAKEKSNLHKEESQINN